MEAYSIVFALCIGLISCTEEDQNIWEVINLKAFIYPNIILKHGRYQHLREKKDPRTETPEIKKQICESVFSSAHFKTERHEFWLDMDVGRNRAELCSTFPFVYQLVFEPEVSLRTFSDFGHQPIYVNKSIHHDDFTDSVKDVYVFVCFVREPNGALKLYYVSESYSVSFPEHKVDDVGGRFVFWRDDILRLAAFAADATKMGRELSVKDVRDIGCLKKEIWMDSNAVNKQCLV